MIYVNAKVIKHIKLRIKYMFGNKKKKNISDEAAEKPDEEIKTGQTDEDEAADKSEEDTVIVRPDEAAENEQSDETAEDLSSEDEIEEYEDWLDEQEEDDIIEEAEEAEEKSFFLSASDVFHIVRTMVFIVFLVSVIYSVSHPNVLLATLIMFFCIIFVLVLTMQEKK